MAQEEEKLDALVGIVKVKLRGDVQMPGTNAQWISLGWASQRELKDPKETRKAYGPSFYKDSLKCRA